MIAGQGAGGKPPFGALVIALLCVLTACARSVASQHRQAVMDLEVFLGDLAARDPDQAAAVRDFAATVPDRLPPIGVAHYSFVEDVRVDQGQPLLDRTEDGKLTASVAVANLGSNSLTFRVVCLVGGQPTYCSDLANGSSRVVLHPEQGTFLPVLVAAQPGSRFDMLMLLDGDEMRPEPASWSETVVVAGGRGDAEPAPPRVVGGVTPVFGGCGFATLVDDLTPRATFTPLTTRPDEGSVWLIVQRCDERDARARLLLFADGVPVALNDLSWMSPVTLRGKASRLRVPLERFGPDVAEVRAAVVLLDEPLQEALFTHPLRLRSGRG